MISRSQIVKILKINGVNAVSPDEDIRSILLSARFNEDEVNTAIMVLHQNHQADTERVDGLNKVFRTESGLNAAEVSNLLGIEVDTDSLVPAASRRRDFSALQVIAVWFFTAVVAVLSALFFMYTYSVGIFHPEVGLNISF